LSKKEEINHYFREENRRGKVEITDAESDMKKSEEKGSFHFVRYGLCASLSQTAAQCFLQPTFCLLHKVPR
jgi:hypothetical protein